MTYPSHLWYFAALSQEVTFPNIVRVVVAGHPIALGRTETGQVVSLKDVCPHRAAPFSAGKMVGEAMQCPYHGWEFGGEGRCQKIPTWGDSPESLQKATSFRAKKYTVREENGIIWVFLSEDKWGETVPEMAPLSLPLPAAARPRLVEKVVLPCSLDEAVVGLMDPAHGPFVHKNWFWRDSRSIHRKEKHFVPSPLGFTMKAHKPSKNAAAYHLLGGEIETEISFQLPGIRREIIRAGRHTLVGLTCIVPRHEFECEIIQLFFWDMPLLTFLKPFVRPLVRRFLHQDKWIMEEQAKNRPFNPVMMLVDDADTQAKWYYKLKRTWQQAQETGEPFENPLSEKTLTWWS